MSSIQISFEFSELFNCTKPQVISLYILLRHPLMRYEIGLCVRSVFAMSSISTHTAYLLVTTDVSRGDCGDVPPVNSDLLVKPLRDVFHLTRGPGDVANKQTVRRYIVEAFRNASTLASALVNKSFVEEQQFDWVVYLFISIQFIPI